MHTHTHLHTHTHTQTPALSKLCSSKIIASKVIIKPYHKHNTSRHYCMYRRQPHNPLSFCVSFRKTQTCNQSNILLIHLNILQYIVLVLHHNVHTQMQSQWVKKKYNSIQFNNSVLPPGRIWGRGGGGEGIRNDYLRKKRTKIMHADAEVMHNTCGT